MPSGSVTVTDVGDSQIWGFNSLRTTRGFTFHEQLDPVGLVHMNGRVYDPHLGRFLSPDPFVQAPGNTQNLNRYSYVINNPLSYTDPSGYFLKKIGNAIGKAVKGAVKGVLKFGVSVAVSFGEPLALTTPMGAFIFFASVAYHVSRAGQSAGGHSPPGAFGNSGNVWRGGGRTVFVPALNGAHGHGFMSAGLTGFALQGHQRGVDSGQEYSAQVSVGAGDLDAGTILVAVMARPLDDDFGIGERFRIMHAALFIYRENSDGSREIVHQYSLGGGDRIFNDSPDVSRTDREYFLEQPGTERYYKIIPPEHLTYDEFVLQVIHHADRYGATGYGPVWGPNSNTAATYSIRRAGGRLEERLPRTPAQCYRWNDCVPRERSGQMKRSRP